MTGQPEQPDLKVINQKKRSGFPEQPAVVQETGCVIMKIQTAVINRCAVYTKLDGLTDHPEHGRCCHTDRAFFSQQDGQRKLFILPAAKTGYQPKEIKLKPACSMNSLRMVRELAGCAILDS